MRICKPAALVLGLALFPCSPADAQAPRGTSPPNAAIKYWQAFAQLPALDMENEKLLTDWNKAPLDAPALKLIDRSQNSRLYLHRAAKIQECDWGLDYED